MGHFLERYRELKKINNHKQNRTRSAIQIIAVFITLACLYFSFRGIDWKNFLSTILTGKYIFLPIVLLISSSNYFIRALRWRVLLSNEKKIRAPQVFWANMVGYLGNAIFPARAGEVIRAVYLGNEQGISSSFVFATCLVERLADVFALVLIGSISIFSLGLFSGEILSGFIVIFSIGVLGVIFIVLLPKVKDPVLNWIRRFKFFEKIDKSTEKLINNLSYGFKVFRNKKSLIYFILFTGVIWTVDALGFMVTASMFHLPISFSQSLVTLAAMGLASAIPSTPGYVGVYQFVAVVVLVPFGYSQESTLAFITVVQIIGFLEVILWGSIGLMRFPLKSKENSETDIQGTKV